MDIDMSTRVLQGTAIMSRQIMCINKTNRQDPHDRIHSVGGVVGGVRWKTTQQQTIQDVERDSQAYYVSVGNNSVWVIVATNNGHKYIKTQNDGLHPNNLLSLPECP
jgi:hypothetical protein